VLLLPARFFPSKKIQRHKNVCCVCNLLRLQFLAAGYGVLQCTGYGVLQCTVGYGVLQCTVGYGVLQCTVGYGVLQCTVGYGVFQCTVYWFKKTVRFASSCHCLQIFSPKKQQKFCIIKTQEYVLC